jgi:hypothetical protein
VGYCGLDRTRSPLQGDEIRPCWDAAAPSVSPGSRPLPTGGPALTVIAAEPPEFSLFTDAD